MLVFFPPESLGINLHVATPFHRHMAILSGESIQQYTFSFQFSVKYAVQICCKLQQKPIVFEMIHDPREKETICYRLSGDRAVWAITKGTETDSDFRHSGFC